MPARASRCPGIARAVVGIRPLVNNGHRLLRNHCPGSRSPCTHLRGSAPPDSDPLGSRPWDIPPLARLGPSRPGPYRTEVCGPWAGEDRVTPGEPVRLSGAPRRRSVPRQSRSPVPSRSPRPVSLGGAAAEGPKAQEPPPAQAGQRLAKVHGCLDTLGRRISPWTGRIPPRGPGKPLRASRQRPDHRGEYRQIAEQARHAAQRPATSCARSLTDRVH